jgi:hypothetical protein
MTSLTVAVRPGKYTVFDSYERNRARGFSIKIKVLKKKGGQISYGSVCPGEAPSDFDLTWVEGATCDVAASLTEDLSFVLDLSKTGWASVLVRGFSCAPSPFAPTGLTLTCVNGGQTITYTSSIT